MKITIEEKIAFPQGVTPSVNGHEIGVKGPKGELKRTFYTKHVDFTLNGNELTIKSENATKREKNLIFTFKAHIKNLIEGVQNGFNYKLKICSGHFPMNVSLKGNTLEIKNFIGEKVPRKVPMKEGAKVNIQGDIITVEGIDKEIVGQVAASIEKSTRRPGFDTRIFQDGIYMIEKNGKAL